MNEARVFDVKRSNPAAAVKYPVRPLLASVTETRLRPRAWLRGTVLDQGQEGACVGHGVAQELMSSPFRVKFPTLTGTGVPGDPQAAAFWMYREAKRDDDWEGENYDGTSVDAGMRVARRIGPVDSWRWAGSESDFRHSLIELGPVVLAIPWLDGMYEAPDGRLRITGAEVGWHCILANGFHPSLSVNGGAMGPKVRLMNSWGRGWGIDGQAWVEWDALWTLIADNHAEMVVPLGRTLT